MDKPLPVFSSNKFQDDGPSLEGHMELRKEITQQYQNLEAEGEINNSCCTINIVTSHSINQSQVTQTYYKRATSLLKSTLTNIFPSRTIISSTTLYPTGLKAKSMLTMALAALIGLLSVAYEINGHGNLVPAALFHHPAATFTIFLIIIITIIYLAAIGIVIEKACPGITQLLEVICFVSLILGVTVLLWALIPSSISWIPWIFFACIIVAVFGVLVYGQYIDESSTFRSTASLGSSSLLPY